MMIIFTIAALFAGDQGGQVAKFESRSPDAEYSTTAKLEDVERCMIRFGSPPQVYRQPDRPDDLTLVWTAGGMSAGNAAARIDVRRLASGSKVRAWGLEKQVRGCAPAG